MPRKKKNDSATNDSILEEELSIVAQSDPYQGDGGGTATRRAAEKTKPNKVVLFETDGGWYYEVALSNNPNRVIAFSPVFARKGNAVNAAKKLADALATPTDVVGVE